MNGGVAARLETLDALRGVGTLLVVVFHLNFLPFDLLSNAYVGLDFFFVLSGLVIAMTYEDRLRKGLPFLSFMQARVIRLYPTYLVGLLLGAALVGLWLVTGDEDAPALNVAVEGLVFGAFMLPAPSAPEDFYPLNGPHWSLLFEMIAYVFYGFLAPRLGTGMLVCVAIVAGAALVAHGVALGHLEVGSTWATATGGLCRIFYSFTIGVLLFRFLPADGIRQTWWAFAPIVLLVVVLTWPVASPYVLAYDLIVILLLCPAIIAAGAMLRPPASMAGASSVLGEISYPVYVIHYPLIFAAGFVGKALGMPQAVWSVLFVIGVSVAAFLLSRLYDQPVRAWLTAQAKARRQRRALALQVEAARR
ncbi:MAG: acyltransferase [Hyphomonadaceae bacterium]|nr:acyltransferase [Hyphomonadaceae bacterium]